MRILYALILASLSLSAHSSSMYERYYDYYTLGYSYTKALIEETDPKKVEIKGLEMCKQKSSFSSKNRAYLDACTLGVRDVIGNKTERTYVMFKKTLKDHH